jgi:hypothetical protein
MEVTTIVVNRHKIDKNGKCPPATTRVAQPTKV